MSSTELFKKHFGDQSASVDLKHPNTEKFFSELNYECLLEDKQRDSLKELKKIQANRMSDGNRKHNDSKTE